MHPGTLYDVAAVLAALLTSYINGLSIYACFVGLGFDFLSTSLVLIRYFPWSSLFFWAMQSASHRESTQGIPFAAAFAIWFDRTFRSLTTTVTFLLSLAHTVAPKEFAMSLKVLP